MCRGYAIVIARKYFVCVCEFLALPAYGQNAMHSTQHGIAYSVYIHTYTQLISPFGSFLLAPFFVFFSWFAFALAFTSLSLTLRPVRPPGACVWACVCRSHPNRLPAENKSSKRIIRYGIMSCCASARRLDEWSVCVCAVSKCVSVFLVFYGAHGFSLVDWYIWHEH